MMVVTQGRLTYRGPLELRTPTQLQMLCEIRSQGETHLQRRFARRQLGPGSLHCCFCIGFGCIYSHIAPIPQIPGSPKPPPSESSLCHLAGGPRRLNLWLNLALLLNACVFACLRGAAV